MYAKHTYTLHTICCMSGKYQMNGHTYRCENSMCTHMCVCICVWYICVHMYVYMCTWLCKLAHKCIYGLYASKQDVLVRTPTFYEICMSMPHTHNMFCESQLSFAVKLCKDANTHEVWRSTAWTPASNTATIYTVVGHDLCESSETNNRYNLCTASSRHVQRRPTRILCESNSTYKHLCWRYVIRNATFLFGSLGISHCWTRWVDFRHVQLPLSLFLYIYIYISLSLSLSLSTLKCK